MAAVVGNRILVRKDKINKSTGPLLSARSKQMDGCLLLASGPFFNEASSALAVLESLYMQSSWLTWDAHSMNMLGSGFEVCLCSAA